MNSWIISIVIKFLLRQLATFTTKFDWKKFEDDLDVRIRALVPGKWFDDEAVAIFHTLIETLKACLSSGVELQSILTLLASEKFQEAEIRLFNLVKKQIFSQMPTSIAQEKLQSLVSFA